MLACEPSWPPRCDAERPWKRPRRPCDRHSRPCPSCGIIAGATTFCDECVDGPQVVLADADDRAQLFHDTLHLQVEFAKAMVIFGMETLRTKDMLEAEDSHVQKSEI